MRRHSCNSTRSVFQCRILEQRLEQGMVFTEYERILKKRLVDGECATARLPENAERNRFQDVLPYDDARVELVPTKENNTGYINASHIKVRGMSRAVNGIYGLDAAQECVHVFVLYRHPDLSHCHYDITS